ncbi:MAG: hypothetical protein JWM37_214 [Candidatus Saccharibacteria bacterium]|nr:hypothetical protein [Candidatus Saccharibacteria bacterium]
MRKLFFIILALTAIVSTGPVYAAPVDLVSGVCGQTDPNDPSKPTVCRDNKPTGSNPIYGPSGILTSVVKILSFVVGVIAIITIMIAGLKMITSGGDSSGVSTARRALIYAVIGLGVTALLQLIIAYVLNKL